MKFAPMMLELIFRTETSIYLRVGALVLVFSFMVFYAINNHWLKTNWILTSLPLQRFKWTSETYLSSSFNRVASISTNTLAFGILVYAHFFKSGITFSNYESLDFLIYIGLIAALFIGKLLLMQFFFYLHDQSEIGILMIDYQYGFNQILTLFLAFFVCLDVFYFRLYNPFFVAGLVLIGILFLIRLLGSIMLLLNNFSYPIVSLFIYLCAFEIVPMLIFAKVLFVAN